MARHNAVTDEEAARIREWRSSGLTAEEVVEASGRSPATVHRVIAAGGGLPPRRSGRAPGALTAVDREDISRGLAAGDSLAEIARGLGRPTSTVSREVAANGGRQRYRAWTAEQRAFTNAARPKVMKLEENSVLWSVVRGLLARRWSPEQIANRLRVDYPDNPEMWVSDETIYKSFYVQGRGSLRSELIVALRSGRAQRRPQRLHPKAGVIPNMVMISERPPEVEDRAVPGHWEGDLIIGKRSASAIGTLVERTTRYLMLLHLPEDHGAESVLRALTAEILTLPDHLRRTLTWDQGKEMAAHVRFGVDTKVDVYFCDPHSPWQRGTNENTNGLLRQYFPKGTDLSAYGPEDLEHVAQELNGRPRKTLGWDTPAERLRDLLLTT
jgi:IS30 family transposase